MMTLLSWPVPLSSIHLRFAGVLLWAVFLCAAVANSATPSDPIRPFLDQYCVKCHGGEKVKGKVDFTKVLAADTSLEEQFELWGSVRDVLEFEEMPPEDEPQLEPEARSEFLADLQALLHQSLDGMTSFPSHRS